MRVRGFIRRGVEFIGARCELLTEAGAFLGEILNSWWGIYYGFVLWSVKNK